jgi:hypothetical protein
MTASSKKAPEYGDEGKTEMILFNFGQDCLKSGNKFDPKGMLSAGF